MTVEIKEWNDIADTYKGGALLLGNGASIAVHSSFKYQNLKQAAIDKQLLNSEAKNLFKLFDNTEDFEYVLRKIWQAHLVNSALLGQDYGTNRSLKEAYKKVRNSLFSVIRNIHPKEKDIKTHLPNISEFLKQFRTVLSLNYDTIVYQAMMYSNNKNKDETYYYVMKDCFNKSQFRYDDWKIFRSYSSQDPNTDNVTLVFYPHGNLMLCQNASQVEEKLTVGFDSLLDGLDLGKTPFFISEGVTKHKKLSINASKYLSLVSNEVFPSLGDTLTIYGWSLGENDVHLLESMKKSDIKKIAISVRERNNDFIYKAQNQIKKHLSEKVEIEFFDSASDNCWIYPEAINAEQPKKMEEMV